MNPSFLLLTSSLFYLILIAVVFFNKKRINLIENKIYSVMIFVDLIGIILDFIGIYAHLNFSDTSIVRWGIVKLYYIYLLTFMTLFTLYIFVSGIDMKNKDSKKKIKQILQIFSFIYVIACIISFCLPFYYFNDKAVVYVYGPNSTFLYSVTGICLLVSIIYIMCNFKVLKKSKYIPLLAFIVIGGPIACIQMCFPGLLLVTSLLTAITILMYFTIENPDMKMIEQLNIARLEADKANNAKSEFLSNMSHEIRTPLNAIVGFSQALKEEDLSKQAKEEVEDIISASSSLLEIVNGILDISKIEAGKLEIVNTEYSFQKIYNELITLTRARIGDKPIEFRTHCDEAMPPVLYGDHTRVKQIVLNLLTNAAKYTKEGYIEFKVNTVIKEDICRIILSVEDSGMGIKEENIGKLFSKFERFDLEKNITIEGTGLGLAITKKLIDLMHGKIVVQSIYGKGSKFTLAIDQKIVPKDALDEKEVPNKKITSLTGKKILIVDDNKLNLKVASRLLTPLGIQTEEVDSGYACLEKIKEGNKYDLILLDDMMPKMSGVETLSYLKTIENFHIPCIALTANAISGMREKYLSVGFDDYLSKPIDKNELNAVLNKFLSD